MDLKFSAVSGSDHDIDEKPAPLGIVMLQDPDGTAWEMRRADGVSLSGSGKVINLRPGSSWLNNLSFTDSRGFFNQKDQQQLVRSGAWIGSEIPEILEEWGYENLDLPKAASFMATICGRISDTAYGLCFHLDRRSAAKRTREFFRSSSLAASLKILNETRLADFTATDKEVEDHLLQTYQNGIMRVGQEKAADEILAEFIFPRLSYAQSVADCDVPLSGQWMRAPMPADADQNVFISHVVEKYGHAALFRAIFSFDHDRDPAWARAVLGHKGGVERTRFTADEMVAFSSIPSRVSSVMIPKSGASRSATSALLEDFVASYGGEAAAALSWTAGLFAENVLMSSARPGRAKGPAHSGESVWMFARDRVLTAPLVSALHESGANIIRARNGRVTVSLPRSAENVMAAAYSAWELGAHMTYGSADRVRVQVGCELPHDRDSWPGTDIDHMIASLTHKGGKRDLWNLDGMCRLEANEKKVQAASVVAAWERDLKGEQ